MIPHLQLIDIDKLDKQSIVSAPEKLALEENIVRIGRSKSNQSYPGIAEYSISLKRFGRELISRVHAEIRKIDDRTFEIFDTDAMNGLFVNRLSLKGRSQILSNGDILQFCGAVDEPVKGTVVASGATIQYEFVCREGSPEKRKRDDGKLPNYPKILNSVVSSPERCQKCSKMEVQLLFLQNEVTSSTIAATSLQMEIEKQKCSYQDLLQGQAFKIESISKESIGYKSRIDELLPAFQASQKTAERQQQTLQQCQQENEKQQLQINRLQQQLHLQQSQQQLDPALLRRALSQDETLWTVCGDSLQSCLRCALCTEVMIDAAVLPCSHGFCRACLECYWQGVCQMKPNSSGDNSTRAASSSPSSSSAAPQFEKDNRKKRPRGYCSVCNGTAGGKGATTGGQHPVEFVRSAHLDNIVWLLVECSDAASRKLFHDREQLHRGMLLACGIDPDEPSANTMEAGSSSSSNDSDSER